MKSESRLASEVREIIGETIDDAKGQEVLCVGRLNSEGLVVSIITAARGNDREVPALMPYMEKGDVVIHNHPSGILKPSNADLAVASRLGNQGIGFYIIDNQVSRIYAVAEPVRRKEKRSLDPDALAAILEPGGRLAENMEGFEPRDSQIAMLKAVAESLNSSHICAAEAGTGVGKSIAYLIPVFTWAQENEERVVISTATINLQQQLVDKDIPLVKKLLSSKIKSALVKGRGNYVCLRRLEDTVEEDSLFREEDSDLDQLKTWALQSPTGSRSELPYPPDEQLWGKVCSEADTCIGLRCRFRERCFLIKARREAASARVLVANHHLLFSDLSMRLAGSGFDATVVLPPFHRIIFDEAHNIENCATSFFSEEINRFGIQKQLHRLFRNRRGRNVGLVLGLQRMLGSNELLKKIPSAVRTALDQLDALENQAELFLTEGTTYRFTAAAAVSSVNPVLSALKGLERELLDIADILSELTESVSDEDSEQPALIETRLVQRKLESIASVCDRFQKYGTDDASVFWLEKRYSPAGVSHRFVITPLDISSLMRESVFEPYGTVVCTSATLSVKNTFDFWSSRIGLKGFSRRETDFHLFPSPFPYQQRVLLGIPEDAPMPDGEAYLQFINDFIFKTLELSEGKGLVLFTSYEMLKKSHAAVKPLLAEAGLTAFKQGDSQRAKLLADFHQDTGSVLFATDSFWQGIDVPGDALQVVIICRLPFRVPSEPVQKARLEAIEQRGGNPFIELSLPEAVMKLKQGFGRLMRRTSDRGVVLILDPRIVKKNYGSAFLKSLPETQVSIKDSTALLADIENFLYC